MGKTRMDDPYTRLANEIILQAVKDYRTALRKLAKNPKSIDGAKVKNEVERFFHSQWFETLTSIDADMLIRKLNEEVQP